MIESSLDTWVCRIPRAMLHALAANVRLHGRERILLAMISELYGHREGGEGATSLSRLERLTGMHQRTIRRVLPQLQADGVLELTASSPGQMRHFRLTGCAYVAQGALPTRIPDTESAHPLAPNGAAHHALPMRTPPSAHVAHPSKEEEKKESLQEGEPFFEPAKDHERPQFPTHLDPGALIARAKQAQAVGKAKRAELLGSGRASA